MTDATLVLLLDEIRGGTLRILEKVADERVARFRPEGTSNSILWHAGHAYVVVEWLTYKPLGEQPQIPAGWFEMFSWESKPATIPDDRWPTLAEMVEALRAQHGRIRSRLELLADYQLNRTPEGAKRSVRSSIVHALHDEAKHSGEMYLLLKLSRASVAAT